ncbi:MAG: TolC family protein [Acidobacteria bacterium]|nr:TolC family protein [Acidobacteriota bacterium]
MKRYLFAACFAVTAAAQTNLTLKQAVDSALKSHPLLEAGAERIQVAEGFRRQAGLMPNPRLVLQNENTRPYSPFVFSRDTDSFSYLHQTFETAGKRDRRVDVAAAGVRRAQLERELLERQIAGRVKLTYWLAAGAHRAVQLLAESVSTFQRIIEYHEIRVKEGAIAEADLLRVRLEGERIAIALSQATLEAERARIHLFREMGQSQFTAVSFADALDPAPEAPAAELQQAVEQRTEMRLARHLIEQARSNLRLQQAVARPNVDVLFGYKRATGFDTMLGGVQMDLPFSNRNQGNIAAATSEIRVAESTLAATEALVRAEASAAQREVELRRRQVGESLKTMLQQADETARIADAAYREGGTDLLRLLDAQRLRLEMQLLYSRALADYRQSLVALETALGIAP